jgi:predicted aspartyl protease
MANQWTLQGIALPAPISGHALFDTGASVTCVDDETAKQLGLPVINMVTIASASHEASKHNVYPISLEILGPNIVFDSIPAVGGPLKAQGLAALIGRDVLRLCTLHYNGLVGQFTLAI